VPTVRQHLARFLAGSSRAGNTVTVVNRAPTVGAKFDPVKSRQYPRTVARTWRYGSGPGGFRGTRRLASETNELTNGDHVTTDLFVVRGVVVAIRSKEM